MPKFKYESSFDLIEPLKNFGLSKIFEYSAFDRFVAEDTLGVSEVHQSAVIELDEEGTTAAAVTYIGLAKSAFHMNIEKHEINLNRPFAYAIIDSKTNEVLFLGKVTNP